MASLQDSNHLDFKAKRLPREGVVEIKEGSITFPPLKNARESPAVGGWKLKEISELKGVSGVCMGLN